MQRKKNRMKLEITSESLPSGRQVPFCLHLSARKTVNVDWPYHPSARTAGLSMSLLLSYPYPLLHLPPHRNSSVCAYYLSNFRDLFLQRSSCPFPFLFLSYLLPFLCHHPLVPWFSWFPSSEIVCSEIEEAEGVGQGVLRDCVSCERASPAVMRE